MDLRLPRTQDSNYSPHPDPTPPPPPPNKPVSPENLTANDRVASYKPAHRRVTPHATMRGHAATPNPANISDSVQDLREGMMSQEDSYDFLDSSGVLVPSDDEAETVSSGSFALLGSNLEDTRSVNGADTEENVSEDEHEDREEHEPAEPIFHPSDSGLTTRPDIRTPEASTLTEKPRETPRGNEVQIVQPIVRSYDSHLSGLSGQSTDELKYSISKEVMSWSGSFRILFAGFPFSASNDVSSPEHQITEKIAAALSLGQPESRTARTYTTGLRMSSFGTDVVIKEIFNYDEQTSDMFTQSIPTTLPDLVVMCNQSMDLARLEDACLLKLRSVMGRRGVPTLNVALSSPAGGYYSFDPDDKSLRICLKSNDEEIAVVPVDLNTFLNLNDTHLNRHLACIGVGSNDEDKTGSEEGDKTGNGKWLLLKKPVDRVKRTVYTYPGWTLLLVGLVLSTIGAMVSTGPLLPGMAPRGAVEKVDQAAALNSALQAFTGVKTEVSVVQRDSEPNATSSTIAKIQSDVLASKETTTKSVSIFEHPFSPRVNDSENFKVHIIGDYHFVLTPPKQWASLKKPPKLLIRIQRGSEEVPFESEKLVDGVHAVRLDRKDAYDTLNVTISTQSKPKIQQNLTVDFGSPWLKMSSWTGKIRTDIAVAQFNARNTSLALFKGLQLFRDRGMSIKDVVLYSANSTAQKALEVFSQKLAACQQLCDRNETSKDIGSSLVNAVKDVDFGRPVRRARKNAARLARKLGEKTSMLGLKRQDKEENAMAKDKSKKGRSCGKKARP